MDRSAAYTLNAVPATTEDGEPAKICTKCERTKPLDQFHKHRTGRHGLSSDCKECREKAKREYYAGPKGKQWKLDYQHTDAARAKHRRYNLRKNYGLTPEKFDEMLVSQGGRCAICRTDRPGGLRNQWHVDHNHKTGKVRGILCARCNVGIGKFGDDQTLMLRGVAYLRGEIC